MRRCWGSPSRQGIPPTSGPLLGYHLLRPWGLALATPAWTSSLPPSGHRHLGWAHAGCPPARLAELLADDHLLEPSHPRIRAVTPGPPRPRPPRAPGGPR